MADPGKPSPAQLPCDGDVRCTCGRLTARLVAGGVEVKCHRCKRTIVVRLLGPGETTP